ncbi:MAG: DUF6399 domain-containing protein [Nodosilinea sp.]
MYPCSPLSGQVNCRQPDKLIVVQYNGYLAQRHHVSRGLSAQALKVLTILHNFDLQRPDGTTAAQRLFGHPFPDLFESVLSTFTELPMPRRSSLSQQPNPWHSQPVPA